MNKSIGDITIAVTGGGTPARSKPEFWKGPIPWATVKDVKEGMKYLQDTEEHISEVGLKSSASNIVGQNSLIVCTRMAVGRSALTTRPTAINQDLKCLKIKPEYDVSFVYYQINRLQEKIESQSIGSTVKGISVGELKKLSFYCPDSLPIQRKITHILSTIDGQIEKIEAIIAKYQAIKQGMLQDLFTRGIDVRTGQLRPRYEDVADLYKDSPLGMIPKEWDVVKMSTVVDVIDPQPDHRTPAQVSQGFPYLGISDISDEGKINYKLCRLVSEKAFAKQRRSFKVEEGDIIFGKIGTIGQPKKLPVGIDYALSANVMLLKPAQTPEFIFQFLISPFVDQQVKQTIHLTSQPAFGMDKIRSLSVVLPEEMERKHISDSLYTQDQLLLKETKQFKKLQLLKQGLMQDLLSGKVEVDA